MHLMENIISRLIAPKIMSRLVLLTTLDNVALHGTKRAVVVELRIFRSRLLQSLCFCVAVGHDLYLLARIDLVHDAGYHPCHLYRL